MIARRPLFAAAMLALSTAATGTTGAIVPLRLSDGTPSAMPRGAVILLWASWCAPCMAELGRLPELRAAAAPMPVVTMALDPPARARSALARAGVAEPGGLATTTDPLTVLTSLGGSPARLPLAVAFDRGGAVCASRHGLLGRLQLREWARSCSR